VSVTQKNRQEKALEQLGGVPEALRVSVVRYLNTAPLIWGLEQGPLRERYRLNLTLPSSCADDLAAGRAEVGILPSFAYQAIPGMAVIPGISIASERKVESVLLVSRKPARRAKRVALDTSSRTSVALVRVLFARHWGADPEYTEAEPDLGQMLKENDAALVIGDPALRFMLKAPGTQLGDVSNLHVYDLAEEWWRLTHLPFVFAFWAVRKEAVAIEEIAHKAAEALSVSGGQLERYLKSSIDYRLDAPHQAGLECFFRFARELGLLDDVRPLEFL
jgi:chorismate dehydratase